MTNIHYTTHSSSLWDCYRVTSRLIARIREYDSDAVGSARLQDRRVKRLMFRISRQANNKQANRRMLKRPYGALPAHISHVLDLSRQVRSRVREKLFSIFEPHTELLLRGKVAKPIEFGHIVLLQLVEEKFITDYDVFEHRPSDESLVDDILKSRRKIFGQLSESFTGEKGFYQSMPKQRDLERNIPPEAGFGVPRPHAGAP